jgi:hypothetical protein
LAINVRSAFIYLFNVLVHNRPVLLLLGWLNRRWHFLTTIFVMYPATEDYTRAYETPRGREVMRWSPWIVGFYRQNGQFGLSAVISSTEDQFRDPENVDKLQAMVNEARAIGDLVGASQLSFAGVLPGILNAHRIVKGSVEARVTVEAIVRAEEALRATVGMNKDTPLVLLGANGFIGRRASRRLDHRTIYSADPTLQPIETNKQWRRDLQGLPVIVLNLATPDALRKIVTELWREAVVLNEVYPEPDAATCAALRAAGCAVYHITGLRALSIPPFPKVYRDGIPCCAGRISESMEPIIAKLN